MRYTALSFDLDGTLVDTAGEIARAANLTLGEFGVPAQPQALITRLIGGGSRQLMLTLLAHVLLERPMRVARLPTEEVLASFERHYSAVAGTVARPFAGCVPMLQRLHDAGVRLACITNKEGRYAAQVLQGTRLDGYFDLVIFPVLLGVDVDGPFHSFFFQQGHVVVGLHGIGHHDGHFARVVADGNIHVYAPLRGRAMAGAQGCADARVFCQRLEAELIAIDAIYLTFDDIPPACRGRAAQIYLRDGACVVEPL